MNQHQAGETRSKKANARLHNWSIVNVDPSGYSAPEQCTRVLRGKVSGHHRYREMKTILTSAICKVNGRTITTLTGSVYELVGDPEPGYVEYLESIGRTYDTENPIREIR